MTDSGKRSDCWAEYTPRLGYSLFRRCSYISNTSAECFLLCKCIIIAKSYNLIATNITQWEVLLMTAPSIIIINRL